MRHSDPPPILAIIVPCYIEAPVLPATDKELSALLENLKSVGKVAECSYVVYVDDRSDDNTWEVICGLTGNHSKGIRLSRHSGHQVALMAGMEYALDSFDCCITIDADLQDDISVIPNMIDAYRRGADIVYGVRTNRMCDSRTKRITAAGFYSTMHKLGVECVSNHADFRLMSSRAVEDLLEYKERNLFLRGIVPLLGYDQEMVYYKRKERTAGITKYPLKKMLDFAADGITSFSVTPVRMLLWLGLAVTAIGLGIGIYTLVRHFMGETIEGWTSLMLSIWFCTGVLLIGLGIIGEYIGKIYIEVKQRPRYKISDKTESPK
ncbi:MAG: glycosyltransferase family 2 protein [Bacteroides sp.]|nr:glycosyltransferase family 2 protein [Bacteroides sp.]